MNRLEALNRACGSMNPTLYIIRAKDMILEVSAKKWLNKEPIVNTAKLITLCRKVKSDIVKVIE